MSVATPALVRTSVFRLGVGAALTSERWRVVLVPELTMASEPSSSGTAIVVQARGGQPGDVVALHRRGADGSVLVARSRLADDLTTTFGVATPAERVTFVARLPRTREHAIARNTLRVLPLAPQTVSATVPVDVLGPADLVTVSGTVRGDGASPCPDARCGCCSARPAATGAVSAPP